MQGKDFLDVAKSLIRSKFEASLRSAISRAYYAVFNCSAQFLMDLGISLEKGPGVHGTIRDRFYNSGVENLIDLAQTLDELRTQRNKADYDMISKDFQNQATCALKIASAELAIKYLTICNKEPLRSQIRKNIQEYERKIAS